MFRKFLRGLAVVAGLLSTITTARADIKDGQFGINQIFDVQYYWSGNTLNASNFIAPYDMNFQHPTVGTGQYFQFFDSTTNPGTYGLGLYNSDGTLAQVVHDTGTLQAIGPDALFYIGSGFFGTVITTGAGYAYGSSASFINMDQSVTATDTSSYTWASTTPLAAGQTASSGGGGAPAPNYVSVLTNTNISSVTPSSSNSPAGEGAGNAVDADPTTKYLNFDRANAGFTIKLDTPRVIRGVTFTTANDFEPRDPSQFSLFGSNDGVNWTTIVNAEAITLSSSRYTTTTQYNITNNDAYFYYFITFPSTKAIDSYGGNLAACGLPCDSVQIGDVTYYYDTTYTTYTVPTDGGTGTIANPGTAGSNSSMPLPGPQAVTNNSGSTGSNPSGTTVTTVTNDGTYTNDGTTGDVTNSGMFTNNGTTGDVTNTGTFDNNGTTGSVTNNSGGTFNNYMAGITGNVVNGGVFNNSGTTGTVDNSGTFTNSGTTGAVINSGTMTNSGTVGTVNNTGTFTNTGTAGDWVNDNIMANSGTMGDGTNNSTMTNSGDLGDVLNNGAFTFLTGDIDSMTNMGTLDVSGITAPSSLGSFVQTPTGTVIVDGGSAYSITGDAQLDGDVTINNAPTAFGRYQILTAGSIDGEFAGYTATPGSNSYLVYSGTGVSYYVTPDSAATLSSISSVAADTSATNNKVMGNIAGMLGNDCSAPGLMGGCMSLNYGTSLGNGDLQSGSITVSKAITPQVRMGISLGSNFTDPKVGGTQYKQDFPITGGFIGITNPAEFGSIDVMASVAAQSGSYIISRPEVAGAEAGTGTAQTNGTAAQLKVTYSMPLDDTTTVSPYIGIRQSQLNVNGYTEDGSVFPLTVNPFSTSSTDVIAGVGISKKLTPKLTASASVGVTQNIANDAGKLSGSSDIGGMSSYEQQMQSSGKGTSASVGAGLTYEVAPGQKVTASVGWQDKTMFKPESTTVGLTWTFSF